MGLDQADGQVGFMERPYRENQSAQKVLIASSIPQPDRGKGQYSYQERERPALKRSEVMMGWGERDIKVVSMELQIL